MGFDVFRGVAAELRKAGKSIREADVLQAELRGHRLDCMEPVAHALEGIAELLEAERLSRATSATYSLLVAIDKAAALNVGRLERRELARLLGGIRTERKSAAARINGAKGGRPRKDGRPVRRRNQPDRG